MLLSMILALSGTFCLTSFQVHMACAGFGFFFYDCCSFPACELASSLVHESSCATSRFSIAGTFWFLFSRLVFDLLVLIGCLMAPLQQNDRVLVGKEYIVEANDSLQSIANRFGTSEDNLVSLFTQLSSQNRSMYHFCHNDSHDS